MGSGSCRNLRERGASGLRLPRGSCEARAPSGPAGRFLLRGEGRAFCSAKLLFGRVSVVPSASEARRLPALRLRLVAV